VAILGAGPAAWAAAAALASTGLRVTLIAPHPDRAWPNTYGTWVDQVDTSIDAIVGSASLWAQVFPTVNVIGERHQVAGRAYGRFDNAALLAALRATAEAGALTVRRATATTITHDATGSTVELNKGNPIRATLVLDGTGAASPFVTHEKRTAPEAFQVAYGIIADFEKPPLPENTCTLMDWRGPDRTIPSFAYTLPIGDQWLVEETALASRPAIGFDELERRLHDRLRADGLVVKKIHAVERVSFPMDVPLPQRTQRTIGLGAAASLVHPATGYSVGASLRSAPRLAAAIDRALGATATDVDQVARAAWKTQWSDDRVKARGLESYGLERVLTMNQRELRSFFDSFFKLGPKTAAVYLGGEAGSAELANVMWKVFRSVPPRLQRRLATGNPLSLARTLLG
jgi:lycopene cyclase-like protein